MRRTPVQSLHPRSGRFPQAPPSRLRTLLSKYGEMPIEIGDLGLLGAKEPFRILGKPAVQVCPKYTCLEISRRNASSSPLFIGGLGAF